MSVIREVFREGEGILKLTPTWVPRGFNEPGKRLRLHPDDYYAFGMDRGGICERWLGSVTRAMNGPKTGETEGMSYVSTGRGEPGAVLFAEAVGELKAELVGEELWERYGTWPAYAKLYDYDRPLFFHLHLDDRHAEKIGRMGKPEAYYFPRQYNCCMGRFPLTYFGFDPSVTKNEVKACLEHYDARDNKITELSRAYRIRLGTGWYTPAGVVHAPGSAVTYEPQWNSDVNTIVENVTMGEVNPHHLLTDCQPESEKGNIRALMDQIDWKENTRPDYKETYFREPVKRPTGQRRIREQWVAYANDWVAAKEVTVEPKSKAVLTDSACYCALIVQGHGSFGRYECETPVMLRFGDCSADEFFVSEKAAKKGVVIENNSCCEPLVILQNFANNNKEVPKEVK
ncbi:hypothetical protein [[Clostridium] hylemonae]|uniref:hypothetical protein n=1 Tax=[Clostridium] hylemonae TaxID=89153 RepID=UPI0011068EF6|nr:hypothetical protein [[Clostridium] hylemonae]